MRVGIYLSIELHVSFDDTSHLAKREMDRMDPLLDRIPLPQLVHEPEQWISRQFDQLPREPDQPGKLYRNGKQFL